MILGFCNTSNRKSLLKSCLPLHLKQIYEALVEDKGKNFIFLRLAAKCVADLELTTDTEVSFQVRNYLLARANFY